MRILVTGAAGLLGINVCQHLFERHEVCGFIHQQSLNNAPFAVKQIDFLDWRTAEKKIREIKSDLMIHCAAMANLDECEKEPEKAREINAFIPGKLAKFCAKNSLRFVHISTDAVFDGLKGDYSEDDTPNPLSVYARTKLEGERCVLDANPEALVVRVNFFGFSLHGNRSLAEFFIRNLEEKKPIKGFVDVLFSPLYAADLVDILMKMVEKNLSGIYHTVSNEGLSKYAFGVRIAEKFGFRTDLIEPISVHESGLLARRSLKLTLNVGKLIHAGIKPPDQAAGLDRIYADYRRNLQERLRLYQ